MGDNQLIWPKYLTVATIREFDTDCLLNTGNKTSYAFFRPRSSKV